MMKTVTVPQAVHNRIRSMATLEFDDSQCVRNPDGTVTFPIDEDVVERLRARFPKLSLSDAIGRLVGGTQ